MNRILFLLLALLISLSAALPMLSADVAYEVLLVTAHPDDETAMAGTIYNITHKLHGHVDLCVITDGEGGFQHSSLASSLYGLNLSDESVSRANLARIRKQELRNAGKILGIRELTFLEQKDTGYALDEDAVLKGAQWDLPFIKRRLQELMHKTHYDFVFCLLPAANVHAHHKAASILALDAVQELPNNERPAVLGCSELSADSPHSIAYTQLKNHPETSVENSKPEFKFDRRMPVPEDSSLNYQIVANWAIAEHKTQGSLQGCMNRTNIEQYWFFSINRLAALERCRALFSAINAPAAETAK
jgi:LmbE family N-acetylglucosaminyl deacetylase